MMPVHVRPHTRRISSRRLAFVRRVPAQRNEEIVALANGYLRQSIAEVPGTVREHLPLRADPERGARIALAYDRLPMDDSMTNPDTHLAYYEFKKEIDAQYEFVVAAGLISIEFGAGDPYPTSAAMRDDVRNNHRLRVFTGGDPHPYLGESNNKFRAIHDLFGHAMAGNDFSPSGEENAWADHTQMFSPLAQQAMTTETRGQNSYFNFHPTNAGKPNPQKTFAPQKVALLPAEFWPESAR